jgi:hypothetical protein
MKALGIGIGIGILILGLTWVFQGNQFFLYKYFGIRTENVRREIFEQSKAYNQGMIQELENMQLEYIKAPPEGKKAMASIILHRASEFDQDRLPYDLKVFIAQLKQEQGGIR